MSSALGADQVATLIADLRVRGVTLYLDGQWEKAGPGDTVLMPRGLPHAYDNRTEADARALFRVSPTGNLAHLFDQLHDLQDPDEVVRQSALHDVEFLPPGSVPGA